MATGTVSPSTGEYLIKPLLEQGRAAIPLEGELQHDAIVLVDQALLHFDVENTAGITLVEVVDRDVWHIRQGIDPRGVDP
ncbi:hypothetical protein D3C79_987570 [compost metagenome]